MQTQRSLKAHNASSSHIGGIIEGLLASSRESTRGVTNALLDRISVISSKSPAEISSLVGKAVAAGCLAAAAAAAPAAAAEAGHISVRHTPPRAGALNRGRREGMPSVQEAKRPPSRLGTCMRMTAAASYAVVANLLEATKPDQALSAVHIQFTCHLHACTSPPLTGHSSYRGCGLAALTTTALPAQ